MPERLKYSANLQNSVRGRSASSATRPQIFLGSLSRRRARLVRTAKPSRDKGYEEHTPKNCQCRPCSLGTEENIWE